MGVRRWWQERRAVRTGRELDRRERREDRELDRRLLRTAKESTIWALESQRKRAEEYMAESERLKEKHRRFEAEEEEEASDSQDPNP